MSDRPNPRPVLDYERPAAPSRDAFAQAWGALTIGVVLNAAFLLLVNSAGDRSLVRKDGEDFRICATVSGAYWIMMLGWMLWRKFRLSLAERIVIACWPPVVVFVASICTR